MNKHSSQTMCKLVYVFG